MKDLLPFVGDRKAAKAWDTLLSREMLGAVIIGSSMGKVVESVITIYTDTAVDALFAWVVTVPVGVAVFVYWHRVLEAGEAAKETVEDTVEDAGG